MDSKEHLFLQQLGIVALRKSFETRERLGAKGIESIEKNQFGDTALRLDVEAEKAVLDVLEQAGISMLVYTEEHGKVEIGTNPHFLAVLDGIDGSDECKTLWETGRYGTMLGIFLNTNPMYGDYVFGGIMEHAQGRLLWAGQKTGASLVTEEGERAVRTSGITTLNTATRIYFTPKEFDRFDADKVPFVKALDGYQSTRIGSTASHYVDLSIGAVDLVIEPTRKGNLELAAAYGLVVEAGGAILTADGTSLIKHKFLEFGQDRSLAIIAAASQNLAREIVDRL